LLNSIETGEPVAMMAAGYLTALRTGAASGVATKYLARENANKVAIIGAGGQGQTQLEAVCCIRNITEARIYDIDRQRAEAYIESMKNSLKRKAIKFILTDSAKEAVSDADVICTATTSKIPLFYLNHLKKGVHINAIGAFTPEMQEIDEEIVVKADKIYVDSIESVLEEAGDLLIPMKKELIIQEDIDGEIGEVVSGKKVGRENNEELTIFKTVGISIQDIAVGSYVFRKAKKQGLGKIIQL
jgi:ornithine cyclodeaminase/alanine dehydrogenase-like protein (mu-crystallin family)